MGGSHGKSNDGDDKELIISEAQAHNLVKRIKNIMSNIKSKDIETLNKIRARIVVEFVNDEIDHNDKLLAKSFIDYINSVKMRGDNDS